MPRGRVGDASLCSLYESHRQTRRRRVFREWWVVEQCPCFASRRFLGSGVFKIRLTPQGASERASHMVPKRKSGSYARGSRTGKDEGRLTATQARSLRAERDALKAQVEALTSELQLLREELQRERNARLEEEGEVGGLPPHIRRRWRDLEG